MLLHSAAAVPCPENRHRRRALSILVSSSASGFRLPLPPPRPRPPLRQRWHARPLPALLRWPPAGEHEGSTTSRPPHIAVEGFLLARIFCYQAFNVYLGPWARFSDTSRESVICLSADFVAQPPFSFRTGVSRNLFTG
jgi:hypothetical protein